MDDQDLTEVAGILGDLKLIDPGLVAAQNWRGGWHDVPSTPSGPVYLLTGAAEKKLQPGGTMGR